MQQETKKKHRGVRREGAGRPSVGRNKALAVKVSDKAFDTLTAASERFGQPKSEIVNRLLDEPS